MVGLGVQLLLGGTAFEEPLGEVVMEPFGGRGEGLGEVGQSGWQPQERERQQGVGGVPWSSSRTFRAHVM